MGHKAAETTCNINNAFGPGPANEHTGQWWFKKFCKGDKSLEDEECNGQPLQSSPSRPSSPLQNFLNHHCTVCSLAVPGPNAWLMLQVVSTALQPILNLN